MTPITLQDIAHLRTSGQSTQALHHAERGLTEDLANGDFLSMVGVLRCEGGEVERGLQYLLSAIRVGSASLERYLNLMRAFERLGQKSFATETLIRAVILAPSDLSAWRAWGRLGSNSLAWFAQRVVTLRRLHALAPGEPALLDQVVDGLCRLGERQQVRRELGQAVALDPDATHFWQQVARGESHSGEENRYTIVAARRVSQLLPKSESSYLALSKALLRGNFALDSIDALMRTICLSPSIPEAWVSLGVTEKTVGNVEYALRCFPRALVLRSDFSLAAARYARILAETGHRQEAAAVVERAVQLDPYLFDAWFTHGFVFRLLNNAPEAQKSFYRCIALRPDRADCWGSLGIALHVRGDIESALPIHARALTLDLYFREGLANQALAMKELGRYESAVGAYAKAIVISPDLFDAYVNSGICNLLLGRFALGWRQYEFRWRSEAALLLERSSPSLHTSRVAFRGDRGSKFSRVLVWAEQGLGDEVMFGGLLPEFHELCGEMIVQVDRRLIGLFTRAFPRVRFLERGKPVSEDDYDEHIPIGSLGRWLRPTRESFHGRGHRYLSARKGLAESTRSFLGVGSEERLVGLSWRSISPVGGSSRSVELIQLVRSLNVDRGFRFLNLQYGDVHDDLDTLRRCVGVEVLSHPEIDTLNDIEGVAGLIEACNLVVSVGNATAHLAGALGRRTSVLLPYVAGWRWLHEGEQCPWYSSVTLYRQTVRGDWSYPLRRLSADIADYVA